LPTDSGCPYFYILAVSKSYGGIGLGLKNLAGNISNEEAREKILEACRNYFDL